MKILRSISNRSGDQRRINEHRALLRHLAKLGGNVFGPAPAGVRREFFCLDEHTWVWHEEWTDQTGKHHAVTTRYDVRPSGIVKSQGSNSYQRLTPEEERNFRAAVKIYTQQTLNELGRLRQPTA
jgi:hypothetical protein